MVESPIFLVGAERSGSTLLRLMLDSHPEITGCEGFEFIVDGVADDGSFAPIDDYHEALATHNIFGSSGLQVDRTLEYPELVNSFLEQRLALSGKRQVASMVHWNFARLLLLWPDARFIHLLRDPRDVARSAVQMGWYGNVWYGVGKWIDAEDEWSRLRPRLRPDQHLEVQFADLIADHEAVLARVCEFVGVDYSEHMLDYAEHTAYEVPQPSKVSQWSRSMPERDVQLVEARCLDLLTERGFEPSGLESIIPGPIDRVGLAIDNRRRMWRKRLDRYGLRLFVERGLVRIIPIDSYRKSVTLRYNEIERAARKRSWRKPGQEFSIRGDV